MSVATTSYVDLFSSSPSRSCPRHLQYPITIADRLAPTLNLAQTSLTSYAFTAKTTSILINLAIGLQVLFGAMITGISAAATNPRVAQVSTAIMGGLSTLAASYLARARGGGEPERSRERMRDLEHVSYPLLSWLSPPLLRSHLI